jgi:hypothetical protein
MASSTREPQPAFTRYKANNIQNAIRQMEYTQIALAKQPFELSELMQLFVDKKHHEHLTYTYDLVEPRAGTTQLYISVDMPVAMQQHVSTDNRRETAHMKFNWYGKLPGGFYVPYSEGADEDRPTRIMREQADPALVERYVQVEQDMLDIHCRFALCQEVFSRLNRHGVCNTPPQMRYVWPCIVTLMQRGNLADEAKELAEPSMRAGDKANVPADIAKYLKETNDTITRALFLEGVDRPEVDLPVSYEMYEPFKRG